MVKATRINKNLRKYSFPRLSGTKGELKAFNMTKEYIKSIGLEPHTQTFTFSKFYPRYYPRIISIMLFWLLLIFYLELSPLLFIINLLIIFSIIIPTIIITRNSIDIPFGTKYDSQNLYVKLNSSDDKEELNERIYNFEDKFTFLFLSHLDSKGQVLSIKFRVISYLFWMTSLILTPFFIILRIIFFQNNSFFINVSYFPLMLNLISTILVCINFTNNSSKGVIDNGTGIAINLELLNYFSKKENRPDNINIINVFTGCEEQGTSGIQFFYKLIKHLDRERTRLINFDSVAKNIDIWDKTGISSRFESFSKLINNTEEFKVSLHPKDSKIYFTRSDFLYLYRHKGFSGITFGDKSVYKYIHSKRDTIDKVNSDVLINLVETIIKFVHEFDEKV